MDAVAYVRVSSRGQSIESQTDAIRRAARSRGDNIRQWFIETKSGRTLKRAQLDWLRHLVRAGEVSKVYVFRLDRLTRSGIRDTLAVLEDFRAHGCAVATVADGFSLEGPACDFVVAGIAWAAQMEREALGERIAAARTRVEASGGRWGRPRAIDPGTLERARAMREEGRTIRQIAIALKVKKSSLHRALSQIGHYSARTSRRENPALTRGVPKG